MKLCTKFWLSMFDSNGTIPIGPNVAPLAVFTFKSFLIILTFSENFLNICCDIHEQAAPVSNRAIISSVLSCLTAN